MMLDKELRRQLLEDRGISAAEACDKCGVLLGPVRFTRKNESGTWCGRECRNGKEAHEPGTCKHCHAALPKNKRRGAIYYGDARRKPHERVQDRKLSRTIPSIYGFLLSFSSR